MYYITSFSVCQHFFFIFFKCFFVLFYSHRTTKRSYHIFSHLSTPKLYFFDKLLKNYSEPVPVLPCFLLNNHVSRNNSFDFWPFLNFSQPSWTRACLKKAFRKLRVPVCGRFYPNEGGVAGYGNRMRAKYTIKWGLQLAEMIFQTCSSQADIRNPLRYLLITE